MIQATKVFWSWYDEGESAPVTATVPEAESLGNFFVRIQYVLKR